MKCPIDTSELLMTDRHGVEIDYCPQCRGVWLDRGELDKIIERSGSTAAAPAPQQPRYSEPAAPYREQSRDGYQRIGRHDSREFGQKKKRKEGFLGDLFDF